MTKRKIRKLVPKNATPFKRKRSSNGNVVWAMYTENTKFRTGILGLLKRDGTPGYFGLAEYGKNLSIPVIFIHPKMVYEYLTRKKNSFPNFVLLHRNAISLTGKPKKWMTKRMVNASHEAFRRKMMEVWNTAS